MIEKMGHYSFTNLPSVYDEEALTALELVARLAGQYNNVVDRVNENTDIITYIKNHLDDEIRDTALALLNMMLENGAFAELVYNSRISVKTFGATGDGVTDDTDSFNTWLSYIAENQATGYIPNGVYNIGAGFITMREAASFTIEGESTEHTVLKFAQIDPYVVPHHIDIRNCDNISLSDFTIYCSGGNMQTAGVGLYLVDCNNSQFRNIDIANCSRGGVLVYSANYTIGVTCDNLYFDNVNIYGVQNDALFTDGKRKLYPMGWILADVTNTTVLNSDIRNIRHYGFEFKNYCKNSWFINCNARRCGSACHVGGELLDGDVYGVEGCGYKNINCYNVDVPILGGSFRDCVFDGITAYYTRDYEYFVESNYTMRIQNAINSFFRVSIFNIPMGGMYFSHNSNENHIEFDYISKSESFIGRVFMMVNSINNTIRVKSRASDLRIDRIMDRVGENIVIDDMMNVRANGVTNYKEYSNMGAENPNSGTTNEAAPTLHKTFYSADGVPFLTFGDLKGDNIQIRMNVPAGYIECRICKDGTTTNTMITPSGVVIV